MRFIVITVLWLGLCATAGAAEITIRLPGDSEPQRQTVAYDCDGRAMSVEYINAGDVSLAVFAVDGRTVVASNVLAASGARYAGRNYIWWTKGDSGDLYDLMQGPDAAPVVSCMSAN